MKSYLLVHYSHVRTHSFNKFPFLSGIKILCSIVDFIIIDYIIIALAFESVKYCKTVY